LPAGYDDNVDGFLFSIQTRELLKAACKYLYVLVIIIVLERDTYAAIVRNKPGKGSAINYSFLLQ
jgi:hypothetical protein